MTGAYELHCKGLSLTGIALKLGVTCEEARRAVTEEWHRDKLAARLEKIARHAGGRL